MPGGWPAGDLEGLIGRTWRYTASDPLGRIHGRLYAISLGDDNPLYHDDAFATGTAHRGVILPPTLIFDTFQHFIGRLDDDGLFEFAPPYLHGALRGGNSYEFGVPARPGDIVSVEVSVKELRHSRGRTGPLAFIETALRYTNQGGAWLGTNHETVILAGGAPPGEDP